VVIDDGSTDKTAQVAKRNKAIVISHKINLGLGAAFRTGVNVALERGASIVVTLDGDMQFNPLDIPNLIEPILQGEANFVTATRYKKYLDYNLKNRGIKNLGNKLFTKLINFLTKKTFTDVSCGFRAYDKESLLRLMIFGHFTYTHEVFLDLVHKGMIIKEVPVKVKPKREQGKSKISGNLANYGYSALKIIFRSVRDHRPLNFFAIPGFYIFIIGLVFDSIFIIDYLKTFRTTPFRTYGMIGAFLNVTGLILILLGLVADMIGRVKDTQEEILYQIKKSQWKRQI
jgi:glycosyltransferase involved in cell wall biosynthesis